MAKDFFTMGIRSEVNNVLKENGIIVPTPVQEQAIPVLLQGKDVLAQAQTGTGKTLAFALPILEMIDAKKPWVQALIITPTRELALQITNEVKKYASVLGLHVLSVYGGQDVERQIKKLSGEMQIVIGTPGRILDHLRRKTIVLSGVTKLVLDEADQMMHMGFLAEVEEVIINTSHKRQTMLFSATMPQQIRALAKSYMRSPVGIYIESENVILDEIKQTIVRVNELGKLDMLCKVIDEQRPYLALVFCQTKQRAVDLNEALGARGYEVDELHGDLSQAKREQVLRRFREAKLQILVASDIAARGLDVEGVTHVINYDIPRDVASYIHRIGRTGRAGETGQAITFVTSYDTAHLQLIEKGTAHLFVKPEAAVTKTELRRRERKAAAALPFIEKQKQKVEPTHGGTNARSRRKVAEPKTVGPRPMGSKPSGSRATGAKTSAPKPAGTRAVEARSPGKRTTKRR